METQSKPVDCRPVNVEQIPNVDPKAPGYQLRGVNIARLSRGALRRFVRQKQIPVDGNTKLDLYTAVHAYLNQLGWPADIDLREVSRRKVCSR